MDAGEEETARHQLFLKNYIIENFSQPIFQDTQLVGQNGQMKINRMFLALLFPDFDSSLLSNVCQETLLVIAPDLNTQKAESLLTLKATTTDNTFPLASETSIISEVKLKTEEL